MRPMAWWCSGHHNGYGIVLTAMLVSGVLSGYNNPRRVRPMAGRRDHNRCGVLLTAMLASGVLSGCALAAERHATQGARGDPAAAFAVCGARKCSAKAPHVALQRCGLAPAPQPAGPGGWARAQGIRSFEGYGYGGTFALLSRARLHPLHRHSRAMSRQLGMLGEHTAEPGGGDSEESGEPVFDIDAPFAPTGDQPEAIEEILERLKHDCRFTVLRGATGTGKTFTMAHVINRFGRPTLLLCHNKTLAAQLVRELKSYFPHNRVELFVSYYNYYQPEAYLPASDTYIAKTTSINDELDALRHRATRSLCERKDVIVVSTVSCIYGLGLPRNYLSSRLALTRGDSLPLQHLWNQLRAMLYEQASSLEEGQVGILGRETDGSGQLGGNGYGGLQRGFFYVTHDADVSDVIVWPPYLDGPTRLRISHDKLESIAYLGQGGYVEEVEAETLYPARHHVTPKDQVMEACKKIEEELEARLQELHALGETAAAHRLQQRTLLDLNLLRETGFCQGMENYSRHLTGRNRGDAPDTLVDFLSYIDQDVESGELREMGSRTREWLLIVDESHVTLPQIGAMSAADRARKESLVRHGFRLPSALDNRPLTDDEFWRKVSQAVFVSATPGQRETELAANSRAVRTALPLSAVGVPHPRAPLSHLAAVPPVPPPPEGVVDMVIRPTNVLDPEIEICPREGQLTKLLEATSAAIAHGDRALVVALTKRDAEDVAGWLCDQGIKSMYLHSDLNTVERAEVLEKLQSGVCEVLVGVNLLREGLDLPQVSLVVVLDADKEGFLRSERSLIQSIGRAARNQRGRALLFADRVTVAMGNCVAETYRRRQKQEHYNTVHGLQPRSTTGSSTRSLFEDERLSLQAELESIKIELAPFRKSAASQKSAPRSGAATTQDANVALGARNLGQGVVKGEQSVGVGGSERTLGRDPGTPRTTIAEDGEASQREVQAGVPPQRAEESEESGRLRHMVSKLPTAPGVYIWKGGARGLGGAAARQPDPSLSSLLYEMKAMSVAEDREEGPEEGMRDGWDDVLYVGKAKNLRKRVMSYLGKLDGVGDQAGSPSARIRAMMSHAQSVDFIITPDGEHDALLLEARLIKKLQPPYNVLLRDDTFYPYICVSLGEDLPRVFSVTRKLPASAATARYRYFGPYTDRSQMRRTLALVEQVFRLRRLRFEARYGSADDSPLSSPLSGRRRESSASVYSQYHTAVMRCVLVLEGRVEEVTAEMLAAGLGQQAAALRSIFWLPSTLAAAGGGMEGGKTRGGNGNANGEESGGGGGVAAQQVRRELDFLGWENAGDAPALDLVAFAAVPPPPAPAPRRAPTPSAGSSGRWPHGVDGQDEGTNARRQSVLASERVEGIVGAAAEADEDSWAKTENVEGVVQILKVREGCVTGRYSFRVLVPLVPLPLADAAAAASTAPGALVVSDADVAEAMQGVLKDHYLSAAQGDLPVLVLTQVSLDLVEKGANAELSELLRHRLLTTQDLHLASEPAVSKFPKIEVRCSTVANKNRLKRPIQASPGAADQKTDPKGNTAIKKTAKRSLKQMQAEREARAMALAVANAKAEALRVSDARQGWLQAAKDLQELLGLPREQVPERIECFDISHTQGSQTVASRVVFRKGVPAKELYRSYNIQSTSSGDDYAAIREVITRRFRDSADTNAHASGGGGRLGPGELGRGVTEGWPDVLVIDGGKGQLGAAVEALNLVGVPSEFLGRVCAIAKRREEIFVVERETPLDSDPHQPALLLLRAARDESHRFALSRHRRARSRALLSNRNP
jgi:excinuclease ABC subunit B